MKKYILLLISILLFSILISCSKENDINNKEHTEIKEKKTVVYCTYCGKEVEEIYDFCPQCGEKGTWSKTKVNEDDLKSKEKEEEESRECKLDTNNDNGIESDSSNSAEKKEDTVQQIIDDPNANLININPNTGEINARPVPCCVRCNKSTNEAYTTGYCNECRSCDICGGEIDASSDYFISLQRCEDCYFREQGSRRQQCSNCGYTALTSEVGTSGECPECNGFTMEYID